MLIKFIEPNFRCKVKEKSRSNANPYFRLLYAASEQDAAARVERLGLEMLSVEPYNFKVWKQKAKDALDDALIEFPKAKAKGQSYEFRSGIWRELKDHLQDLFYWRCAYCEAFFKHVEFGDVEHFRPKAEVTGESHHMGYYWLAYDPSNYLPSCKVCNEKSKQNWFPISGQRAFKPGDPLDKEDPLLYCMYNDLISEHIEFYPSKGKDGIEITGGLAHGKTKKGTKSIQDYDLNREWLVRMRKIGQERIRALLKVALTAEDSKRFAEILARCARGEEEYSCAVLDEIRDYFSSMGLQAPTFSDAGTDGGR